MAVTVFKTFSAGEILTASDLNSSFTQITDNGEDLGWPATKAKDLDGNELILDADGDTGITADTDDRIDLKLQGQDLFKFDGTTASAVDGLTFGAVATGSPSTVTVTAQGSSTNINLNLVPKGSGTAQNDGAAIGTMNDLVDDTTPQLGGDLDCNGAQIQWSQGADVASATALPVLTDGNYFDVTGTTTVTSIDTTGGAGTVIKLHFDDALILTHHATNLILPGGANITTAADDEAEFVEYGSGTYRCTNYTAATGKAIIAPYFPTTPDYDSGEQTITLDATLALTHNLGGLPGLVQVFAKCTSADQGYAADEYLLYNSIIGTVADAISMMDMTTTKINITTGDQSPLISKSSFNLANMDVGTPKWKWVVRAWKA